MRRAFVIFLILLFPLNVSALSMSVASMQPAEVSHHVHAQAADDSFFSSIFDAASSGDLDADEPPAVFDLHDTVNEDDILSLVLHGARQSSTHVLLPRAQLSTAPLKPPPLP